MSSLVQRQRAHDLFRRWLALFLLPVLFGFVPGAGAGEAVAAPAAWEIDVAHSGVTFQVRHFFTMTPGRFGQFGGTVMFDEADPANSSVELTIDAASINTDNAKRDEHLRSADFFNVEKFPTLAFKSTKVEKTGTPNVYNVTGEFTMLGVTKPLTVSVEVIGIGPDSWGGTRGGFNVTGSINRKDFGMVWNKSLDTGGLMLGEEVKISVPLELVKKKA